MDSLFDTALFEQNAEDVTTAYTDYGLQVTINIRMDRRHEIGFARSMRRVLGVKDCQVDTTVKDISENTTFVVTFLDRPGIVHVLADIRQQITQQAKQYVQFVLAIPKQSSLF